MRLQLAVILFVIGFSVRAQQYFFKNYSVESGLPFIQVYCMYQDSNGYLWTGGYGGLSRFDGKEFVNYNRKNGLVDHSVNAISGDAFGSLYIGTNKGLTVLRNNKFTTYETFEDKKHPTVTSFCKGYHHSMYIGTTSGLFMHRDNKIVPLGKLKNYKVNCLLNPDTSVIFVGTNKGLILYGHNTFEVFNKESGLPSDNVLSLERFQNYLAIGTDAGLTLYNLNSHVFTTYKANNGLIDETINALENQSNRHLWICTPEGLMAFDGKEFSYFTISDNNNSNNVRSTIIDREGNLWFGTHSGLYRFRDNSFANYDNVPGLSKGMIFQVFRDKTQSLYICTGNAGVFRSEGKGFTRFGEANGLPDGVSHAALQDRSGRLYFGGNTGLYQFQNDHFVSVPLGSDYQGACEILFEDRNNILWVGGTDCFTSVQRLGGKFVTKTYQLNTPEKGIVYGFAEDQLGRIYIGTFKGGLWRLDGGLLENLSKTKALNEETFFTLKYFKGKIFAASLNGVLVYDIKTGRIGRINDTDGLNSELAYSIEFSRDNQFLWIGTNQGINRLDLALFLKTGRAEITAYGLQEGFSGVECNGNGIWEDKDGTLWFGTVSGLIRHQPFQYRKNQVENKTVLQGIELQNEDTLLENGTELSSDLNVITFYYRGICLTNPEKVRYQRRLAGLEKNWTLPSEENFIKYSNLAPGSYTFMVRSCNNEGIWNTEITSFVFKIKPPFYLTWWFILLSTIIVFGSIYTFFALRIYNIKKKQKLDYDRKVEMSKIELKALRSQMNPHFIFNSLNSIQHYIFNTRSDEAIKYLNKFARLVRVILNNSEKPTVTVGDDLEALKLYLELEKMRFEEKFDYTFIIDESVDLDYDIMPPLLMQPYVENAILHGLNPKPEKGILTIHLHSENNFLICTITDNGIGREKASEIRRTMPVKKHKSMGMKITEDRLKILNAINNSQLSVTITDLRDEHGMATGTKVELFVPLNG